MVLTLEGLLLQIIGRALLKREELLEKGFLKYSKSVC